MAPVQNPDLHECHILSEPGIKDLGYTGNIINTRMVLVRGTK